MDDENYDEDVDIVDENPAIKAIQSSSRGWPKLARNEIRYMNKNGKN